MKKYLLLILFTSLIISVQAQQAFSIREAVKYGLDRNADVKNAIVGRQDTEMEIQEIKVSGLPQIKGQFQFTYNAIVPSQLLDAKNFNPDAKEGEVVKFKFGVPWGGQAGVSLNQLIYDATWLVGLRAADTYRLLADQKVEQSKTTVAENIIKAYYSVLVAQERGKLIDINIERIDSLLKSTGEMYKQGFVEKLDVDRLSVQKNNLLSEKSKISNLVQLSYQLLKYQMSMDSSEKIILSDNLEDQEKAAMTNIAFNEVNPEDRIEFKVLQTNQNLIALNAKRFQKSAIPNVFFSGSFGYGHSNPQFNPFQRWFPSSALSLGMNIPIYDSGLRKTKIERQRLTLLQMENTSEMLKRTFALQNEQAFISINNGLVSLQNQKENLGLAEEVLRVSKIKYSQGLGTNLEVVNAENDLRQAQTNYIASLYDVLVAKVDLEKAQGKLILE